jgi:glycosyltransferase involved in cell wall biosynthesis
MKILHVIPTLDPKMGGPVEGSRQLATANRSDNVETEFACCDDPESPWLRDFGFKNYALGPSYLKYKYNSRLVSWIKANAARYDGIVVNGLWQFHSYAVYLGTRANQVPYVVFPHGMLDPWFNQAYPLKAIKKLVYWKLSEHAVLSNARCVVFTCEEERKLARLSFTPYNAKEEVIGYGISDPQIDREACRKAFWEKFPALKGKKIILFVGRINPKKGCDLLLGGFKKFRDSFQNQHCNYHLVFAGPPESSYMKSLKVMESEYLLQDHVTWAGMLTGNLKWGAFLCADVFCLPSHQENFGIVVAESLSIGCPVLISDKVNIHQEVSRDHGGFVETNTVEGTYNLLKKWNKLSFETKEGFRISARACFIKNFLVTEAASKLRKLMDLSTRK